MLQGCYNNAACGRRVTESGRYLRKQNENLVFVRIVAEPRGGVAPKVNQAIPEQVA